MYAILLEVAIMHKFIIVGSGSKDSPSKTYEEEPKLLDLDNDPPDNELQNDEPHVIWKTKHFLFGSGKIIGKNVILDFFTCIETLPSSEGPILKR